MNPKFYLPITISSILVLIVVLAVIVANRGKKTDLPSKAAGGTVDTLPYILGKHSVGQSSDPKSNGITNYVVGNSVFYVKNSSGTQYEYRTWDANNIYLKQDTSVGGMTVNGQTPNSYTFGSGIWLKRFMTPGEVITVFPNLVWYNNCTKITDWSTWYYKVSISGPTNYNVGGDLGNQNVIIMKYDYLSGYEIFYYSLDWGWVRWEEWDTASKTIKRSGNFNRLQKLAPIKTSCGTPQPNIKLPTPTPTPKNSPTPSQTPFPTKTPEPSPSPTPTPAPQTHTVCENNTCKQVSGAGNNDCSPVGSACGTGGIGGAGQITCPSLDRPQCFDCNVDYQINILDFSCFKEDYGKYFFDTKTVCSEIKCQKISYDCNKDGQVNILDFACFANNYQKRY